MYAYREQLQTTRNLYAVPQKRVVTRPQIRKNTPVKRKVKQKKKTNLFIELLRSIVTLTFLSAFAVFILPTSYNRLIKQVFHPTNLNLKSGYENTMAKEDPAFNTSVNLYSIPVVG